MMPDSGKGMLQSFDKNYQALQQNDAFYRGVVDLQADLICRFNDDGLITFANPAFSLYFQLSPDEISIQTFPNLLPEAQRDPIWLAIKSTTIANPVFEVEYNAERNTGQPALHWWNIKGIFNAGLLTEFQAIGHILPSKILANIASIHYTRQINAIYTATMALLTNLDLESLISQILDAAFDAIPSGQKGALHLIARDTGELEMRAALGYQDNDPRIKKLKSKGWSELYRQVRP